MSPIRKKAGEIFDIHASDYDDWMKTIHTYDHTLDVFCNSIDKTQGTILDLACGPGNIIRYLLEVQPQFKILGIDLAPKMIEIASDNFPQEDFKVMDFRSVTQLNQKCDGIICGFGLPYINKNEAIQLIYDAHSMLNSKGILYLSTMENDYSKSKIESSSSGEYETQMYYHEGEYLKKKMLSLDFEILLEERIKSKNKKGEDVVDLILICKKT